MNLILFELKKILNNKKAFLFLLVLNITPIITSLILLVVYISFRGFGFGDIQFAGVKKTIQYMFTGHFTLFSYIAPFFLALIVGDSFSTEFGKGYMKMLLVTPVKRWQVITAKTLSIITFLVIAVALGGIILQSDLLIAKAITQPSGFLPGSLQSKAMDSSIAMVTASSASQLLVITFIANLMLIGFFIMFSMFFESAILMSFCSLSAIMAVHVFYWSSDIIKALFDDIAKTLVANFEFLSQFCFTRHFTNLLSVDIIQDILDGKLNIMSDKIYNPLGQCLLWSLVFYVIATIIFSRKQILH